MSEFVVRLDSQNAVSGFFEYATGANDGAYYESTRADQHPWVPRGKDSEGRQVYTKRFNGGEYRLARYE